ncbi:hypothetical protein LEP1GSC173_2912 [Leptospira interrogans str. HAI1594]|nr:hypothetical protein LEP1GSC173_2912 [Leptospira interrogans str. HAI1594]
MVLFSGVRVVRTNSKIVGILIFRSFFLHRITLFYRDS